MLFSLRPKEHLNELFGRENEYEELSRLVASGLWVAVMGKRMTGKTSLIKTFANENNGIYVNLLGAKGLGDVVRSLMVESGMKLESVGIDLKFLQVKWSKVAEDVFAHVKDKVIVFDEVQEVASYHFLKVLKSLWDKYENLKIIFSGSYIGVLRGLLEPKPTSPLYGRAPVKMILKPFNHETSKKFLEAGFMEYSQVNFREAEIEEAVEKLNGYVGWLTYYGNFRCVRKLSHEEALNETVREGCKILVDELNHFLRGRQKEIYIRVLRLTRNGARWSEIKRELNVNSKVLSDVLKSLTLAMIVEEEDGYYWIEDSMMKEAIKRIR